jgi:hypothetical protein
VEAVNRTHLHKELLQDTMALEGPVAFADIDVDWDDPVKTCIDRLWSLLPRGGILIFDIYSDWGGCKKAVDEFFATVRTWSVTAPLAISRSQSSDLKAKTSDASCS